MISFVILLTSSIICLTTFRNITTHPTKIVDIVHNNIPKIIAPYVSDVMVLLQIIGTIFVMEYSDISKMFLSMAIIQLMRAACSSSTALPPLKHYNDKYRFGGVNGSGTEYIFSGHASISAYSAIYLWHYNILPSYLIFIYNLISQFLIVSTHNHYTVDVILAWIIVPLWYSNMYLCLEHSICSNYMKILL